MRSRDIGQDDFENTVTVPGPRIRSRFVDTEDVPGHAPALEGLVDELRCPSCGTRFPGVATHCPDDDTPLRAVDADGSADADG